MNPTARLLLILAAVLFGVVAYFALRPVDDRPSPAPPDAPPAAPRTPDPLPEPPAAPAQGTAAEEAVEPAPPPAEEPKPGLIVTGVVRDEEGRPVGGATVVLTVGGSIGGRSYMSFEPPLGEVETEADGRFRFDVVPPGQIVTVTAKHPDYGDAAKAFELLEGADAPPEFELVLESAGVLSGTVLDADGNPVAGATVYAIPGDAPEMLLDSPDSTVTGSGSTWKSLRTTSGPDGRYRIGGLKSGGTYFVRAKAEGHAESVDMKIEAARSVAVDPRLRRPGAAVILIRGPKSEPLADVLAYTFWTGFPERVRSDEKGAYRFVGLKPGEHTLRVEPEGLRSRDVKFTVEAGKTTELEVTFGRGHSISGQVVNDLGEPVPNATVEAQRPLAREYSELERSEGRTTADAEGRFRIDGLLPGPHAVLARAKGYESYYNGPFDTPADGVRIEVRRYGRIVAKLVLPAGAEAPERVGVGYSTSFRNEAVWGPLGHGWTSTGVEWNGGAFDLASVASGPREILIRVPGFRPERRKLTVQPGETIDLGEIRLGAPFELHGRVVDLSGAPVAAARVVASQGFSGLDETATAGDGGFRVGNLGEGETQLEVEAEGFVPSEVTADPKQGATPVVVRMRRGGLLEGSVFDADGKPVTDVDIEIGQTGVSEDDRWMDWFETDLRGLFRARAPEGTYAVTVMRDGEVLKKAEAELTEGATLGLRIDLP